MNTPLSNENFGLVIAYILPGFVALWGVSYFSPTVESWITAISTGGSLGRRIHVRYRGIARSRPDGQRRPLGDYRQYPPRNRSQTTSLGIRRLE